MWLVSCVGKGPANTRVGRFARCQNKQAVDQIVIWDEMALTSRDCNGGGGGGVSKPLPIPISSFNDDNIIQQPTHLLVYRCMLFQL